MTYSIGGTEVIHANGKINWDKILVPSTLLLTVNSTVQTVNTGGESANAHYIAMVGSDLRAYRVLGACNCACDCACSGGGE